MFIITFINNQWSNVRGVSGGMLHTVMYGWGNLEECCNLAYGVETDGYTWEEIGGIR